MARSSTGEHFCKSELQETVRLRSLVAGGVAFDILCCLKDDHLQTSEYSLQVKYKEEMTTTAENVYLPASLNLDLSLPKLCMRYMHAVMARVHPHQTRYGSCWASTIHA